MPRIKFLDVLEETKQRSNFVSDISGSGREYYSEPNLLYQNYNNSSNFSNPATSNVSKNIAFSQTSTSDMPSDYASNPIRNKINYLTKVPQRKCDFSTFVDIDNTKVLSIGILFIFLGGLLFISGYSLGKKLSTKIDQESQLIAKRYPMMDEEVHYQKPKIEVISQEPLPVDKVEIEDTVPVKSSEFPIDTSPQTVKASAIQKVAMSKKIAPNKADFKDVLKIAPSTGKQYVIQVSAHSNIKSARLIEDALRKMGYASFICENMIGDTMFYRVRVHGTSNKQETQKVLEAVRAKGFGSDSFILEMN